MSVANKIFNAYSRTRFIAYRGISEGMLRQRQRSMVPCFMQRYMATEKSAEKEAALAPETPATEEPSSSTEVKLIQQVESISKQLEVLKEKQEDLMNKYKRALADSENLRVRLTKQIADAKVFGIQSFCKDLLEVADILGHAMEAVPKDQLNEKNLHLKNLYDGLTMTKASLLQVFKRHGLEPVDPLNKKFDPNYHEALFEKDDPEAEPNTIIVVTKLGYKLHERCIRPALVGVAKST